MSTKKELKELDRRINEIQLKLRSAKKMVKHYKNSQPGLADEYLAKQTGLNDQLSKLQAARKRHAKQVKRIERAVDRYVEQAGNKYEKSILEMNKASKLEEQKISLVSGGSPGLGKK